MALKIIFIYCALLFDLDWLWLDYCASWCFVWSNYEEAYIWTCCMLMMILRTLIVKSFLLWLNWFLVSLFQIFAKRVIWVGVLFWVTACLWFKALITKGTKCNQKFGCFEWKIIVKVNCDFYEEHDEWSKCLRYVVLGFI